MRTRATVSFKGRVQGVYFRRYTKQYSDDAGVTGWVRNEADGTVTAVLEGEREDVLEVIRKLKEEHPHARVDSHEAVWSDATGEFPSFELAYR